MTLTSRKQYACLQLCVFTASFLQECISAVQGHPN